MLALGLADQLPHFRIDLRRLDAAARSGHRHDARGLSDRSTFRSIRAGGISWSTASTAGPSSPATAGLARPRGAGARRVRSRHRQRAARCRRRAALALSRRRQRQTHRPLGGPRAREPRHVRARRLFSSDPKRSAARRRRRFGAARRPALAEGFQVTADNPLVGLDGRAALLRRSGEPSRRPRRLRAATTRRGRAACSIIFAGLADRRRNRGARDPVRTAAAISGRSGRRGITLGGIPLGDCWRHPAMTASRRHQRAGAAAQAVAMARLFADRAAAAGGHHGHRYRRPDRACRISQRRPVHRHRRARACAIRPTPRARTTCRLRRWWSNGAR